MQLGIIGNGFVGNAIAHAFIPYMTVRIHDKDPEKCFDKIEDVINNSDVVFVCVPTPMTKSGKIDLSIVESVFSEVQQSLEKKDTVFERHARFDFLNQSRIVLGSKDKKGIQKVKDLYEVRFSSNYFIETTYETAELIKYFNNLFFAVKVSFMNEMKLIADKLLDVQWDKAVEGFVSDGRVGDSHLQVPGPDGKRGFGGSCFPKDINAFIDYSKSIGVDMNVLEGAWKTNLNVRPEKDWEKLKGRAVSDD